MLNVLRLQIKAGVKLFEESITTNKCIGLIDAWLGGFIREHINMQKKIL